jgi:hypothetical protein
MTHRHLTTAITLVVLVGILVAGLLVGTKTLFAPIPSSDPSASPSPTCSPTSVKKGQRIRSKEVRVSVFNAGTRSGRATDTMRMLTARGFTAGSVGNAPSTAKVKRVRVYTTQKNDLSAELVARQFGRRTKVVVTSTDLGPGIDVVVGDGFDKLSRARNVIVVRTSSSVCVPVATATPADG